MENKNSPAVSIIIPMYNTEKYIAECLDSILAQTFKNFEVILVDNGSTDNSLAIAESYIPKFAENIQGGELGYKIITLEKNTGGPCQPRNIGMDYARGEYLFFADSDDVLSPTALEEIYSLAKKNDADVLHFPRRYEFEGETLKGAELVLNYPSYKFDFGFVEKPFLKFITGAFWGGAWAYLYEREFILRNKIRWLNGMMYGEDRLFAIQGAYLTKKFFYAPNIVYYWRQRSDSVLHVPAAFNATEFFKVRLNSFVTAANFMEKFMNRFEEFQTDDLLKFITFRKFSNHIMDVFTQDPRANELSMLERYNIAREFLKGKVDDEISWIAHLINISNDYRADVLRKRKKIAKLQKQVQQLQEDNQNLKIKSQSTTEITSKLLESVGKVKIFISKLSSIKELAYETNDKITIFTSLSALRRSQYVSDVLSKLVKK